MRLIAPILLLLLLLLMFAGAASATDYYVCTWGDNTTQGNITHPWQNVSYATQQATAGDTIHLFDGIWYGESCEFAHSGNLANRIVLTAYNGTPTLNGEYTATRAIDGSQQYYTVSGLTILNYTTEGIRSYSYSDRNYVIIENNTISNVPKGIYYYPMSGSLFVNSLIKNNTVTNTSNIAIYLAKGRNNEISYNDVTDSVYAIHWTGNYTTLANNYVDNIEKNAVSTGEYGAYASSHNIIRNNTITNNHDILNYAGLRFDYNAGNNISIYNNTLTNTTYVSYGGNNEFEIYDNAFAECKLYYEGGNDTIVKNNTFSDVSSFTVYGSNSGLYPTINLTFEGNTLTDSKLVELGPATYDSEIKNNIFVNMTYVGAISLGYLGWAGATTENITIANNVFYDMSIDAIDFSTGTFAVNNITIKNNIFSNTLKAVDNQKATNVSTTYNLVYGNTSSPAFYNVTTESNNIYGQSPLFASPATDDFHLNSTEGRWNGNAWVTDAASSPCIDMGDPSDSYVNEPSPNGDRINMGAYGNTDEASKSAASTPSISNVQNGSISSSSQWINWTVNQTANNRVIYDVGSVNAGSTACDGQWSATHACTNASDGNWSSYAESAGAFLSYAYFNYTVPSCANRSESLWHVRDSAGHANLTIPSACWGGTIYLRAKCSDIGNSAIWQCDSGAGWTTLRTSVANIIYEEEMTFKYTSVWDNSTAAPNITLTGLTASTTYNFHARSYNTTDTSFVTNSSTYSFTTAAAGATNDIILAANEYALINNWTTDQTYQQVDNNISNTVCFSYYNSTSGLWEAYRAGYTYGATNIIPKNNSAFVFVDAQTTVSATVNSDGVTIQNASWFYSYLPGSTAKTLTEIETAMNADSLDVWSLYGFSNSTQAYTNTGSYSVDAGEGYTVYVNTTGEYTP